MSLPYGRALIVDSYLADTGMVKAVGGGDSNTQGIHGAARSESDSMHAASLEVALHFDKLLPLTIAVALDAIVANRFGLGLSPNHSIDVIIGVAKSQWTVHAGVKDQLNLTRTERRVPM